MRGKSFVFRLFSRKPEARRSSAPFTAPIATEEDFFAIGDIHGCHELLLGLLEMKEQECPHSTCVCVGDYIDRGEQSALVLQTLLELQQANPEKFVCLLGNHEEMLLKYLGNPYKYGERWLRYGGLQTLASYRVPYQSGKDLHDTRDALAAAIGDAAIAWLKGLPLRWVSGNVHVVHAGLDPSLPIETQSDKTLLWGHPEFEIVNRTDENWVLHGHTIVDDPSATQGRISVDTGAYATGRLTAAQVSGNSVKFLQA